MLEPILLLTLAGIGHASLIVLAVNVTHGLGSRSRWIEPLTLVALALLGVLTLAFAAWAVGRHPGSWPELLRHYAVICAVVAVGILPLATLALHYRRRPPGIEGGSRPLLHQPEPPSRKRWIGPGPGSWLLRLPGNQALDPAFEDWEVVLPALPASLAGLRILHLTDLHLAPCFDRSFFEAVLDSAQELQPDLVLLTGDIVEHREAIAWVEPLLSRLRGRLGQFAILGNHDLHYGQHAIRLALDHAGFTDLDGHWTALECPETGGTLALGGTSAPWGKTLDPASMPPADLTIVLSHSPDLFYRIARWNAVDLVLAGHNHGGQIRLPALGPILMPSRFSRRFDQGYFRRGRTLMYVSRGLGAKHPLRYNCPPELTRLILQPTPASLASAPATVRTLHG